MHGDTHDGRRKTGTKHGERPVQRQQQHGGGNEHDLDTGDTPGSGGQHGSRPRAGEGGQQELTSGASRERSRG